MTVGRYAMGLVFVALIAAPPALGGRRLRRRLLPGATGPPGVLVDTVLGLGLLLFTAQLTGAVGLFRLWPVIVAGAAVLSVVVLTTRNAAPERVPDAAAIEPPAPNRWLTAIAMGAVSVVAAQWGTRIATAYSEGITSYDSLHYHLPHAARFVQDGWLTHLHFVGTDSPFNASHPSNSEVVHALGMLAFDRDVLSPLINLGALAILFLAAWCAGRPKGLGPATVVAAAVVMAMPASAVNAGSAFSDVPSEAFLLACVAILLQPIAGRGRWVCAATAAGLAVSTKLTVLAPVVVLTVGVVVMAQRGARGRVVTAWIVPLAATGSFWYLRNVVNTGSPLPALHLGPLPRPHALIDPISYNVLHYVGSATTWRHWYLPGLATGMSPAWWAIGPAVAIAIGLAFRRGDSMLRLLAVATVVTIATYLVVPTTAMGSPGSPVFFALNLRYVFPALLIGLVLLPLAPVLSSGRRAAAVMAGLVALLLASEVAGRTRLPGLDTNVPAWAPGHEGAAFLMGAIVIAGAVFLWPGHGRLWSPRLAGAGIAIVGFVVLAGGYLIARHYVESRYASVETWAWAQEVHHSRIAVVGFDRQYPFYGSDLTNYVQYVGRETADHGFVDVTTCADWRARLGRGRYDFLVIEPRPGSTHQTAWTESDPGAHVLLKSGSTTIYKLDRVVTTDGCSD